MKKLHFSLGAIGLGLVLLLIISAVRSYRGPQQTSAKTATNDCPTTQTFTVLWSIYVGWMPWPYADESGILKKWACKYGIAINLKQADYVPSIEAYVAGDADGVLMTNMDALTFAGTAGVDSTAVILGDFSNGNDAVITRNNVGLCDLKGKNVNIVQYSVSHYLLARALQKQCAGTLQEKDLILTNTSDSDIAPVFIANQKQPAVVTWNPMVLEIISQVPDSKIVFDSSDIPYEILDIMFLRTNTVAKHPELARALTGAWFETLQLIQQASPEGQQALEAMAKRSGGTLDLYKKQLATTSFWVAPSDAVAVIRSEQIKNVMVDVAKFSFEHGLFGPNAKSPEAIGVSFPDGSIVGSTNNVKVRFTDQFMQEAADARH